MSIVVKALFGVALFATTLHAAPRAPFGDLPLDMTGREYAPYFEGRQFDKSADPLDAIMAAGRRNLDWLEFINAARADGQKLELSTAATQRGYPIDHPGRRGADGRPGKGSDAELDAPRPRTSKNLVVNRFEAEVVRLSRRACR